MTSSPNPPAFPRPASIDPSSGTLPDGDTLVPDQAGMSLRDYFAARVLAADVGRYSDGPLPGATKLAAQAYRLADAMLLARAVPAGVDLTRALTRKHYAALDAAFAEADMMFERHAAEDGPETS